jgi:hypothetical protein
MHFFECLLNACYSHFVFASECLLNARMNEMSYFNSKLTIGYQRRYNLLI